MANIALRGGGQRHAGQDDNQSTEPLQGVANHVTLPSRATRVMFNTGWMARAEKLRMRWMVR